MERERFAVFRRVVDRNAFFGKEVRPVTSEQLAAAMENHGDTVYRLALCRLQNRADAEDVYQDVFLRLYGQRTENWDEAHLRAWLIRTAVNRCADIGRQRQRKGALPLEEGLAAAAPEGAPEVWAAVAVLPEKLRVTVHLHYGEGYTAEEIAAMLRIPAVTVRTRLYRGRQKLRELLGGDLR